ncbi:hypothetical protein ACS862_002416, partial [Escherichia coli]
VFMPEADSLKHPQQFYLTILFPQIVLSSTQISPIPPTRVPYPKAVSLFTQKIINVLFFYKQSIKSYLWVESPCGSFFFYALHTFML